MTRPHCPQGHEKTPDNVLIRTKSDGRTYALCRTCRNEGRKKYEKAARQEGRVNRDAQRAKQARYYRAHREAIRAKRNEEMRQLGAARVRSDPEKDRVRWKLRAAVRSGKIIKPANCEECGSATSLHGHHDDYAKPLDVRWLCSWCHAAVHASERRAS